MTVVVTGSGSGIGEKIVERLQAEGREVLGISKDDGPSVHRRCDVTDRIAVDEALQGVDPIKGIINCAGVNWLSRFDRFQVEDGQAIMDVNLWGAVNVIQSSLYRLAANRGVVINMISNASHRPMTHSLAYNASKAAIAMATRQMAHELTPEHGIIVMGLSPNKVAGTRMSDYIDEQVEELRGWTWEQVEEYQRKGILAGHEIERVELAHFAVHLLTQALMPYGEFMSGCIYEFGAGR